MIIADPTDESVGLTIAGSLVFLRIPVRHKQFNVSFCRLVGSGLVEFECVVLIPDQLILLTY